MYTLETLIVDATILCVIHFVRIHTQNNTSKNLNSIARPYDQQAFSPLDFAHGSGDIHVCFCYYWCSGTGMRFPNRKETRCLPPLNAGFEAGKSETPNHQQTECPHTKTLSYGGSSKNLSTTVRLYDKWACSPPASLPIGFRTWLWRYDAGLEAETSEAPNRLQTECPHTKN